jgi:NADH dehydrogenase
VNTNNLCILGGTGFVGRHLLTRFNAAGIGCRVLTRHPHKHRDLQVAGVAQLVEVNLFDNVQLRAALEGCQAVVNLVGILNESAAGASFQRVHVELGDRLLDAAKWAGVPRLLHMSALQASETSGSSAYLKSKGEAENRAHTLAKPQIHVTSFRPSVIFGPGDSFFNRFADLLQLPGPFPLACPDARFAPVYVGDVAEAFARALDARTTWGKSYELCGPRGFTLKALVQYTAAQLGLNKRVIGLSDRLSRLQARALERLPGKPFSYDNYLSLQTDSLCSKNGLEKLGIQATDIDSVVPLYLAAQGQRQRYSALRRVS